MESSKNSTEDVRDESSFVIADRTGETIEIAETNLSLTLRNLNGCKVSCGPVVTAVYLDNCSNSMFQVAGQQVFPMIRTNIDTRVFRRFALIDCLIAKSACSLQQVLLLNDQHGTLLNPIHLLIPASNLTCRNRDWQVKQIDGTVSKIFQMHKTLVKMVCNLFEWKAFLQSHAQTSLGA